MNQNKILSIIDEQIKKQSKIWGGADIMGHHQAADVAVIKLNVLNELYEIFENEFNLTKVK